MRRCEPEKHMINHSLCNDPECPCPYHLVGTCVSISGMERQYRCKLDEGHLTPCDWINVEPSRGTEPGRYDHVGGEQ